MVEHTTMTGLHRLHNVLFWILLAGFLVTTSTVLFFTFGYRFSFERGIFVYTGSVTIKSNPRDVRILVDGESVPENRVSTVNRSLHVTGLRPGNHLMRIEADGFVPWEKRVTVRSGVSVEFWNIVLPRETYDRTTLLGGNLSRIFPAPFERRFAITTETDGETRVLVMEKSSGDIREVFSDPDRVCDPDSRENIEWSHDGKRLLVPLRERDGNGRTLAVVDLETGTSVLFDGLSALPEPRNARWDPANIGSFLALSGDTLFRVDPDAENPDDAVTTLDGRVRTYDLSGREIYFLRHGEDSVFHADLGRRETAPESVPTPIPGISEFRNPKLAVYDEKRIAVYDIDGSGYFLNDDGGVAPRVISLGSGIRGAQFSDDGKKFLFFTGNEISVVFTRDWEEQPYRESGDIVQVARFSADVSHPQWTEDYEHVLFAARDGIKLAELDRRDRRNIVTVIPFTDETTTQLLSDFGDDRIYLISGHGDADRKSLSFIRFPEPLGFFE